MVDRVVKDGRFCQAVEIISESQTSDSRLKIKTDKNVNTLFT